VKSEKYRDLTLLHINAECSLVIACDSCGGIGSKELDVVKVDPEVVGYFTAAVVLCELLAFRAIPQTFINNFCVEMNPTGKRILVGIKEAIEETGLDSNHLLTGSTEENIPVMQTGIGLTCIGIVDSKSWIKPKTKLGDELFAIGIPKVGTEVEKTEEMSNLKIISQINNNMGIHEILPVGSKGIDYEVSELCRCNKLAFSYTENIPLDIKKSAGPVTCVLVSGKKDIIVKILEHLGATYNYLGKFY